MIAFTSIKDYQNLLNILKFENERYRKALQEISKGEGRYDTDRLIHLENTLADMIEIAENALKETEVDK